MTRNKKVQVGGKSMKFKKSFVGNIVGKQAQIEQELRSFLSTVLASQLTNENVTYDSAMQQTRKRFLKT